MTTTLIEAESMGNRLMPRIALMACGSFSPPTPMHFRMFEIARDHFELSGTHRVIGGIVSPTHDAYGKKDLAPAKHRYAMSKLALQTSSWVRVSDWEIQQPQWTRTQSVLQHHQNYMNNHINSPGGGDEQNGHLPGWLPPGLREQRDRVQLKLLCGADLLESFAVPGLWAEADIEDIIANHGIVVISRSGANAEKFIFDSDILTKYQRNITLITNWVPNEVSSTMIRRLLKRGQSVKYLIDDLVIEYIKKNGLFNVKTDYIIQLVHNLAYTNRVNINANERTPSDDDGDGEDTEDDDNSERALAERMDESDYAIKNVLTSFNLDNRRPRVFCCGDNESVANKLLPQRTGPGQAVKVITSERTVEDSTEDREEQTRAKKKKPNVAEMV